MMKNANIHNSQQIIMSLIVVTSLHDLQLDLLPIRTGNEVENELDGLGLNKPTYRKSLIYQRLKSLEVAKNGNLSFVHVPAQQDSNKKVLTTSIANAVHTQGFLQFFDDAWDEWSQLVKAGNADSYMSLEATRSADKSAYEMFVPGQIAPRDLILVDKNGQGFTLSRPGKSILARICYYALDRLTPVSPITHTHLVQDLTVVQTSVDCLFKYASERNGNLWEMEWSSAIPAPFVYSLTTQPGHHAGPESFGGYCYINYAAVAASLLSNSLKSSTRSLDFQTSRIGVLDIDYHAGNGTMSIFYQSSDIFFASLHADPEIDYIYNVGHADQEGHGEGLGFTINVPLPQHTNWETYQQHLRNILDKFRKSGVKALVVSIGVDTVRGDPECSKLGGFDIELPDYTKMGDMIREFNVPTIFIQEGGYHLAVAAEAVQRVILP